MIRNRLKWIISARDELGLLQMVLEPDTGQCVMDCEIPYRLERRMKHSL